MGNTEHHTMKGGGGKRSIPPPLDFRPNSLQHATS